MKKLKGVQHVCVVSEHSHRKFRIIGHMTKKLLKFQTFKKSSTILWYTNEDNEGCATFMHSQWTLSNGYEDYRSQNEKAMWPMQQQMYQFHNISMDIKPQTVTRLF